MAQDCLPRWSQSTSAQARLLQPLLLVLLLAEQRVGPALLQEVGWLQPQGLPAAQESSDWSAQKHLAPPFAVLSSTCTATVQQALRKVNNCKLLARRPCCSP